MLSVAVTPTPDGQLHLHATTVCYCGQALVIAGPSGCGKSSLALRMMSLGASLIADDATLLGKGAGGLIASRPPTLPQAIEVRGLGLLNAPMTDAASIAAVLDLGQSETARLPAARAITLLGYNVPLLHRPATPYLAEAMVHYLKHGPANELRGSDV